MTLNEVAPPGFGHTKGDKKKGVEKGGTAAAFDRARKEGRFKGSKSDMFAIMWSQKNKGDKPHYKPGTDEKYKKYQKEDLATDAEKHRVPRGPGGNPIRIKDKVSSMKSTHPLGQLKVKYGADKVRDYYKKNKAVDEGVTVTHKGTEYKMLPSKARKDLKKHGKGGLDGDYRTEGGKVKDYVTDKLGLTNTKRDGVKCKPSMQGCSEAFEIDKSAHKTAQKKAKMRNLARGNQNPNEKAAAEKKAGGPKLIGEGKKWDSYKKAVATVLGKKKEKKAEKATDAGARAKRKLQRKVHAKYVSGSEDLVPDDMRD